MTTTVGDILRASLRKIGVLGAGEALPSGDSDDALVVFRQMVDAWALETLLIPTVQVVTHPLLATNTEYTIGVYGSTPIPDTHIETARPEKILASFIRDNAGTDYTQKIINVETYSEISRKSEGARPSRFYVRKGWPSNTILFESLPYANETLYLEVVQPLSTILPIVGLTEAISLPPGYEKALVYNAAMDLAPEWGKSPDNLVVVTAVEAKKKIKRGNYRKLVLGMDSAITNQNISSGTYDINSGP